jgi:stage III sporulation protein SpoIIIAA
MALVSSHNCGVPLVASAHAESVGELLRRPGIRLLHEAEIFGAYVGISRQGDMDFSYRICYRNDAEKSGEKPCL